MEEKKNHDGKFVETIEAYHQRVFKLQDFPAKNKKH